MFNVGDKIVHPMHGAGTISAIEEKNICNETEQYYIISMPGEVKVMVPINCITGLECRFYSRSIINISIYNFSWYNYFIFNNVYKTYAYDRIFNSYIATYYDNIFDRQNGRWKVASIKCLAKRICI